MLVRIILTQCLKALLNKSKFLVCCDEEELAFPVLTAFFCLQTQIPWGGLFIYPVKLGVGVFPVPPPTSSRCMKAAAPLGALGSTWHLSCKRVGAADCTEGLF